MTLQQRAELTGPVPSDETLLDQLQHTAFSYFLRTANPANGLIADTTRKDVPASVAVVGFALSAYPVAVERGWMARTEAVERAGATLRFFWSSEQSHSAHATGYKGLYYRFLDMQTGARVWTSELSTIDTALLLAGALTVSAYFTRNTRNETELRELADALYRRADWPWAQHNETTLLHGWKPECGFLNYRWEGYSEALILYVLALGSPTYPLATASYPAWTATYQWEHLYGHEFPVWRALVHAPVLARLD